MPQSPATPPGAAFAYEAARHALDDQLRRIEAQDAKSGVLIAAAGIFAGFLFSGRSFLVGGPAWFLVSVGLLVTTAVVLALLGVLNQRYVTAPEAQAVARLALRDEVWLKWRFLGNLHTALEWNRRKLDRKTRFLTAAQAALIIDVVLVGGYFVSTTVHGR